jgi:putative SOS response-associated peptidase YedK
MSVAGIWEMWHPGLSDENYSFSILTTQANELMGAIHNRMPVILGRGDEETWLDPEIRQRDVLQNLLRPCPSSWLNAVGVSTLVNSSKNNTPEILEPHNEAVSR